MIILGKISVSVFETSFIYISNSYKPPTKSLMQVQIKKRSLGRQNTQQTDLELEFKIKIPSQLISKSSNIVVSGQIQPQGNNFHKQPTHNQPVKDKKLIAQRLLSKKSQENREHHAHDDKQKGGLAFNQSGRRSPEDPQAANYREPRQRTRENQPKGIRRQPSSQPVQTKQYPCSKKMAFLPQFNQLDGIFTVGNQLYGLRSLSGAGFMIVNEYPCSTREPSYIKFRVILPNLEQDDCGIGITYKPLDLIKCKIKKNPVKRCVGYYFASQKLLAEGLYYPRTIKYSPDATYRLIVNTDRQQVILVDDKDIILGRTTIPAVFLHDKIYVYLELKNAGKIQIIQ